MNFRIIFRIVIVLLVILALGMCVPALWDSLESNPDWAVFANSAWLTGFFAILISLACRGAGREIGRREGFVLVASSWVVLALFAAVPLMFSKIHLSFTDAVFEAMSGLTTTGSTVITGLDGLPPGLLIWRSILQWLGGLGIIVMAVGILPMLRVGGMQLFKVEAFDAKGNDLPRAADFSGAISLVYVVFTLACGLGLHSVGLSWLDALSHAMTAVATGGYSTSDASIAHFDNPLAEAIIIFGMAAGGVPFLLITKAVRGKPAELLNSSQVRLYLTLLLVCTVPVTGWLALSQGASLPRSLRMAAFSVVSIMTGTGFVSGDYTLWGPFPIGLLFVLTFVGGCAGSTARGITIFRFQVLFASAHVMLSRLVHPHKVVVPRYDGERLSDDVILSVLIFFCLFMVLFAILTLALVATGLDFVTAISSAATSVSNVGPGLGPTVGPSGTFQDLSDSAKWLLIFGMLMGRLEVFSVLVIFLPMFWRN